MRKGQYQLLLGFLIIVFIGLSIGLLYYVKFTLKHNQTTTTTSTRITTTTTTLNIYYRPFNLGGAVNHAGEWKMPEDQQTVINALKNFPKKPTMLVPVIQRLDPDKYAQWVPFINQLKEITPNLCFGIGEKDWDLNDAAIYSLAVNILKNYINDTKCVAFENFNQIIRNTNNDAVITKFLTDIHNLGFEHIMPTNYRERADGQPWSYIDAVQTPLNTTDLQINIVKINNILPYQPNVTLIFNYESPNGQLTLASLSNESAIKSMANVSDAQNTSSIPYRWMPVWSGLYDAYKNGTLSWMANKLAEIDP
jgi:hypothetical protein